MNESTNRRILQVSGLRVEFATKESSGVAVDGVDFDLYQGEILGIVGESGSGKTVTAMSILGLLTDTSSVKIEGIAKGVFKSFQVENLLNAPKRTLQSVRGKCIGYIFQDAGASFSPVKQCGKHLEEVLILHGLYENKIQAKHQIINLFKRVSLADPERIYRSYPHQLSGGQLQRVQIAMALATKPEVLICDEPTTALDAYLQKEIVELLGSLSKSQEMALIFVSHDLGLIRNISDRLLIFQKGKIVENGETMRLFNTPIHPYTKHLVELNASSRKLEKQDIEKSQFTGNDEEALVLVQKVDEEIVSEKGLTARHLTCSYPMRRSVFGNATPMTVLKDISFTLNKGEILGIVGESGSGKSSLAKCLAGLLKPDQGDIIINGQRLNLSTKWPAALRREIQMVFQDPYHAMNPVMSVKQQLMAPLAHHKIGKNAAERIEIIKSLLSAVGLDTNLLARYPHELSGGQRQRINIARALSVKPEVLICDEITSSLDVTIQDQILKLLKRLHQVSKLSMILISHDFSVISSTCDRVAVMYDGQIVEIGRVNTILRHPKHPYTKKLLNAVFK